MCLRIYSPPPLITAKIPPSDGRLSLQLKRPTDDFLKAIPVIPKGRLRESREENITKFSARKDNLMKRQSA